MSKSDQESPVMAEHNDNLPVREESKLVAAFLIENGIYTSTKNTIFSGV